MLPLQVHHAVTDRGFDGKKPVGHMLATALLHLA
jgi:hypothetical protein